jgi:hypothetical protein
MKQIKTKSTTIGIIKVSKNSTNDLKHYYNLELNNNELIYTNKVLGKLSDLTDKDCEELVLQWGEDMSRDIINSIALGYSDIIKIDKNYNLGYKNYIDNFNNNYTLKAKESFISLLQSKGIDTSNDDKLLIIKML